MRGRPTTPSGPEGLSIRELRTALRAGTVTAAEAVEASRAARRRVHADVNAVVTPCHDRAAEEARAITADDDRPLAGVPFTVKDSIETAGVPTTAGVTMHARHVPAADAPAVAALRRAGALLVGKSNVPPLAGNVFTDNRLFGRTSNPWDTTRSPGGSSGGSAAAVATFQSAFDLGSDTAGSLLVPAHFTGLCAHKATRGLIDNRGHVPPRPGTRAHHDITTFGVLARTPDDLGRALAPWLGAPDPDPVVAGRRVALWTDDEGCPVQPAVAEAVAEVGEQLRRAGCRLVPAPPLPALRTLSRTAAKLVGASRAAIVPQLSYAAYRAAVRDLDPGRDPSLIEELMAGTVCSHREWLELREVQLGLTEELVAAFAEVDALVAPVAPTQAFAHPAGRRGRHDEDLAGYESLESLAWSAPSTVCGAPSTVVPAAVHGGLPIGVQIVSAPGADRDGLALAVHAVPAGARSRERVGIR